MMQLGSNVVVSIVADKLQRVFIGNGRSDDFVKSHAGLRGQINLCGNRMQVEGRWVGIELECKLPDGIPRLVGIFNPRLQLGQCVETGVDLSQ